jgi:hypothetical protein
MKLKKSKRHRHNSIGYATVDALVSLCAVFLIMFASSDVPPQPKAPKNHNMLVITMTWGDPDFINADVDLWAQAPSDTPVGFSNSHGKFLDLVRDDLGKSGSPEGTSRNMEMMFSRNAPPGEYVVNVVMFHSYDNKFPVPVEVTVQCGEYDNTILTADGVLTHDKQEITVARFTIDDKCDISNVNNLFMSMFTG